MNISKCHSLPGTYNGRQQFVRGTANPIGVH